MTEFECQICRSRMKFDLDDESSYLSKVEVGNPLIGKLYSVRISHSTPDGKSHVNVIVVDPQGDYRAHKDSYVDDSSPDSDALNLEQILPFELRPFAKLASESEIEQFSDSYDSKLITPDSWYSFLKTLHKKDTENRFFSLLFTKWAFILGKLQLPEIEIDPERWEYPLILRLRGRKKPTPELLEATNNMKHSQKYEILNHEVLMAKAENYVRFAAFDLLEEIYQLSQNPNIYGKTVESSITQMIIQAYYGFGLYRQGNLPEAIKLIEPAFNFGQVIGHREMLVIIGNLYGSLLRVSGDLEKATQVYQIVLNTAAELGDERSESLISISLAIVEHKQGKYEKSLARQIETYESPNVQSDFFLKYPLINNISETLIVLERYDDAKRWCQLGLDYENLPVDLRTALLDNLKTIAGKTRSKDVLLDIRQNLPDDDFMKSPRGRVFLYDLAAIEAELNEDWVTVLSTLGEQLKLMTSNNLIELANDIELRISEAYYELYRQENDVKFLNQSYRHLDLAKAIALETHYYPDLCRLSIIKGLLAAQSGMPERARVHLNDAMDIAQTHELTSLVPQVEKHLASLDKGSLEGETTSLLSSLFKRLSFSRREDQPQRSAAQVHAVWVQNRNSGVSYLLDLQSDDVSEHSVYLSGVADVWALLGEQGLPIDVDILQGSHGVVLIEESNSMIALALTDRLDYLVKLRMQEILQDLEKFPMKDIKEEFQVRFESLVHEKLILQE